MLIKIKIKVEFIHGVVHNVNSNLMKLCQNIIVIVVNSKILSMKEIFNPIHVVKFVEEKEVHTVLILVHSVVIKENVNHASIKGL
jgi:hypothetical protein